MAEHVLRQPAGGGLAYLFKDGVAQIVEQHAAEPRKRIGADQGHRDADAIGNAGGHAIDGALESERHHQAGRFRQDDEGHGDHDAGAQRWLGLGPQIGNEALEGVHVRRFGRSARRRGGGKMLHPAYVANHGAPCNHCGNAQAPNAKSPDAIRPLFRGHGTGAILRSSRSGGRLVCRRLTGGKRQRQATPASLLCLLPA